MFLNWDDTIAIARRLNNNEALTDENLINMCPHDLEEIILNLKIVDHLMPEGELRDNTLNAILWQWMRLRDETTLREAG